MEKVAADAIFELKIHQNAFADWASPRTPLGKFTALPQTPSSWGRGLAAPPENPTAELGPTGLQFLALGLKEVVYP